MQGPGCEGARAHQPTRWSRSPMVKAGRRDRRRGPVLPRGIKSALVPVWMRGVPTLLLQTSQQPPPVASGPSPLGGDRSFLRDPSCNPVSLQSERLEASCAASCPSVPAQNPGKGISRCSPACGPGVPGGGVTAYITGPGSWTCFCWQQARQVARELRNLTLRLFFSRY